MPLRDDHEAAIARADALERELEQERAKDREETQRVERLEADVAAARERITRAESELAALRAKRKPEPAAPPVRPVRPVRPDPAPIAPHERKGSPVGMLVFGIGVIVTFVLVFAIASRGRDDADEGPPPPEPPKPPFVAATIVAEGLLKVPANLRLGTIVVDYVGPDGLLDPTYGRVVIETERPRPPPPPDDPNRPTGAPAPRDDYPWFGIDPCPEPRWSPSAGWTDDKGGCFALGEVSTGPPRCTVTAILAWAKKESAPPGLASMKAQWMPSMDGYAWRWTFEIKDPARGVSFDRELLDADCPPAERANPP